MNKNSDPVHNFLISDIAGEDSAPNSNFSKHMELSEISRAIGSSYYELQVNTVAVTWWMHVIYKAQQRSAIRISVRSYVQVLIPDR